MPPASRPKVAVAAARKSPPVAPNPASAPRPGGAQEPAWLVRLAILLFLAGFAAFLAREVRNLVHSF